MSNGLLREQIYNFINHPYLIEDSRDHYTDPDAMKNTYEELETVTYSLLSG
jgi:hypothetical protein